MKVFFSYSWDSDIHIDWVRKFAERLEADGIDVNLDQWGLSPGQPLTQFMETSIRENDYVLIICTPAYKKKSDDRDGGVGYEGHIISAELLYKKNYLKFIPILRSGSWEEAAPSYCLGRYYIDLRENSKKFESEYIRLRNTLRGIPLKTAMGSHKPASFDDIKIYKVTEYLLGRAFSGPTGIRYTDGALITENSIREILKYLEQCTRNGGWITILYKNDIDEIIDTHLWKNGAIKYSYNEAERGEIMARCARSIKYRMEQYAGENHILFNIYQNGDIGFRYK